MCIAPTRVYPENKASVQAVEVPCRKCWACLKNKTNILVGKTLMEYAQSDWAFALTLTYDDKIIKRNHELGLDAAKVIHKPDFQNFMAYVRKEHSRANEKRNTLAVRCSYLVAGEYGERKRRSHFHVILMGDGIPPRVTPIRTEKAYMPAWPWGFTFSDIVASDRTVHYVAKYLVKELRDKERKKDDPRTRCWVSYSKRPPLGDIGFEALGKAQAAAQIMPQNMNYIPPLETRGNKYSMTYAQERTFWRAMFEHWPQSEIAKCTEWVYNSRLRFIKHRQKERWESLDQREKEQLFMQSVLDKLRHGSVSLAQLNARLSVYDNIAQERESDSSWRVALEAEILEAFLAPDLVPRVLHKLRRFADKASLQEIACLIALPKRHLLHNLCSERAADKIHLE